MAKADFQSVELPPIIDLDTLDNIRDTLLEAIEQGSIKLDASKVERVATNALLMMLSTARSAENEDVAFELSSPSPQMLGAIDRLGLNENFTPLIAS